MMTYQSIQEALGVPKIKELRSIWDFNILLKDQIIFFFKKSIIFCILFHFEKIYKYIYMYIYILIYFYVFHELHVFISKYN